MLQHVSSSRFLLVQVAERHVALAPPEQCRVTQAADGDVLVSEQSLTLPFPRHHHPTAARLRGAPSDAQSCSAAAAGGGVQRSGGPAPSTGDRQRRFRPGRRFKSPEGWNPRIDPRERVSYQ